MAYVVLTNAYSQQITPLQTTEQCPGVNITFTVTIAGQSVQSVQPKALNVNPTVVQQPFNISVSGGNVTFSFVGRFADNNNKQTFTVFYTNASNQAVTQDFTFPKIKSLLTANSFSQIYPNPTSITSPPCQINTHTISFNNVQYGNPWETPPIGYGLITTYEYLLPAGWVLNGITSNGTNWIAGNNNVTVTSDLANGNGSNIRIRPTNVACGNGLIAGQEAAISITRPKPVLSFSGNSVICNSQNFEATNVPGWVTGFLWEVTPGSVATVINPNSNPATVQKQNDGFANIKLTISNPSCGSYEYNTSEILNKPEIVVGTPQITGVYYNPNLSTGTLQSGQSVCAGTIRVEINEVQATTYSWQRIYGSAPYIDNGGYIDITLAPNENVSFLITATSSCGSTGRTVNFVADDPQCGSGGGFFRFSVSPNPVKGDMNVIFDKPVKADENITMRLYTFHSFTLVKQWKLKGGQKQYSLNKAGVKSGQYILEVAIGNAKSSQQVIIK